MKTRTQFLLAAILETGQQAAQIMKEDDNTYLTACAVFVHVIGSAAVGQSHSMRRQMAEITSWSSQTIGNCIYLGWRQSVGSSPDASESFVYHR
jgi:hypothetical protein